MALYSRTEDEAQARKVGATTALSSVNTDPDQDPADQPADKVIPEQYIYIDEVEATIPANRNRGLTAPGWWKYRTYTDAAGNTRHKAQHLVAFKSAPANPDDTDDRYAADAIVTITIDEQPSNQSTQAPAGVILTFTEGTGTTILSEADAEYESVTGSYEGDGTGATFTITRDENGDIDEVILTDGGSGYEEEDEFIISGIDIGGLSGAVDTFTEGSGTTLLAEAEEEYTAVSGTSDGNGTGATFTIIRDVAGAIDTVTLVDAGTGYVDGEEILIDGADIGGVTGTDNLVITVDSVINDDLLITVDTVTTASVTFSVTASADPSGTLLYQWQTQTATGTRWTNISGATTDELVLTGLTTSDSGKKYRVKVTSSTGAPEVTSNVATLTVTAA
jgi:hypothetical protein